MMPGSYSFFSFQYVCTNVRPVQMCVRTNICDPVRLGLRHLYQVVCSFIVRYPTAGHPCTVDTFLVVL